MLFIIVPLSVVLLGVIVYFALSPHSSKSLRLAALGALGAIMLSIMICLIIIFATMGTAGDGPVMPDFLAAEAPQPPAAGNSFVLALLAAFLLAFLGIVIFLSMRERKNREAIKGKNTEADF
jgi:ABC-type Fe3+ transport system permease subunit